MDTIQIYTAALIAADILLGVYRDWVKGKFIDLRFFDSCLDVIVLVPIIGRIFNWW